jgi:hydroxymethylglutaryl-CoA lyase
MSFLQDIYIEEQGLRDGLQSVLFPVSTEQKLRWIEQFVDAGVQRIQLGSFVHPKLVPMMSDTDILFNKIAEKSFSKTMVFSALVLNEKGIQRAIECNVKHLSISLSASNTHSLKNTGKDIKESKIELAKMIKTARQHQIKI